MSDKAMQLHYNKILKIQETEKIMKITQENWNIICHGSLDYQLTSYQKWVFLINGTFLYLQLFRRPRRGESVEPDSKPACVKRSEILFQKRKPRKSDIVKIAETVEVAMKGKIPPTYFLKAGEFVARRSHKTCKRTVVKLKSKWP